MSYTVSPESLGSLRLNEPDRTRAILQNVAIILGTWKGSAPLYRDFGLSAEFLHKPVPVAKSMLRAEIREAIEKYEPRVRVVDIIFSEDISNLVPSVEVTIIE